MVGSFNRVLRGHDIGLRSNPFRVPGIRYVVLDVETTGLSPWKSDRVVEIGAVALKGGDLMAEFNTLIQVPRDIPFHASQIHGITDEMLIGQPTPEEVFPALHAFIRDSILVAHNARFDLGFLRREYELLGTKFHCPHICTLKMSRNRFPHLSNHKLETVYRHLIGANGDWGHDAEAGGHDQARDTERGQYPEVRRKRILSPEAKHLDRLPRIKNMQQIHRALDDARMVARIWLAMEGVM